ncbi:MAG: porin family protein [Cytophaga sp.]|uniref:porin family protein n=1 Tax=Cytophaga sp. TaxID=29535 RepID=UPI003F80684A
MKKTILSALTVGFLFVANSTFAQVTVGPKLGLNISKISADANSGLPEDAKSKIGFQVGGMLNAQLNDYFAIRPELLFNNVGSKFEQSGATMTVNTNYLSLPVNFVGQYPVSDNFKLQAFAGPYAALGLGGKYKIESDFGNSDGSVKMAKVPSNGGASNTWYMNSLDFGLNFGIGAQISSFVVTANYGLGLTNLTPHYKDSAAEDTRKDDGKLYNRNITIGVAYLFGGK